MSIDKSSTRDDATLIIWSPEDFLNPNTVSDIVAGSIPKTTVDLCRNAKRIKLVSVTLPSQRRQDGSYTLRFLPGTDKAWEGFEMGVAQEVAGGQSRTDLHRP